MYGCGCWAERHSDSSQIASSVSGTYCLVLLLGSCVIKKGFNFVYLVPNRTSGHKYCSCDHARDVSITLI